MDGMLMFWAYGWAALHPERKLAYNIFLTVLSAFIALAVGLVEVCMEYCSGFGRGRFGRAVVVCRDAVVQSFSGCEGGQGCRGAAGAGQP
jgi:hypothetical protein